MRLRQTTIATVAMLMLVLPASTAVAQDDSPPPDPATTLAESVLAGEFPAEFSGAPWSELTVLTGAASLEASGEEDQALMAEILEELDATIDDVTVLNATWSNDDFSEYAFGSAMRVADADAARLLELFVPAFADDVEFLSQEAGEVSGRDVTILRDSEAEADSVVSQPIYFYATDDTLYVVSAPEAKLTEFFDTLP